MTPQCPDSKLSKLLTYPTIFIYDLNSNDLTFAIEYLLAPTINVIAVKQKVNWRNSRVYRDKKIITSQLI